MPHWTFKLGAICYLSAIMNKTGFGFLRLPRRNPSDEKSIDYDLLNTMVDYFLAQGGNYFDTAYTYLDGVSEVVLRKAVVERYPRESFRIADKLPGWKVKSYDECKSYFEEQLSRCGVDYFDVYLIHWLNEENYEICERYDEFAFLRRVKAEGKAKKIGFSYHDSPELLDRILSEHPEVDYVQLQINYLDWDSVSIQARKCYDTAVKYGKKVIVMEPVKGGSLANIPDEALQLLYDVHPGESAASWAIRFAASLSEVEVVLSGMNTMEQIEDNMRDMHPLGVYDQTLLSKVAQIIRSNTAIPCTGCNYCAPNCPVRIPIPAYFALYNDYSRNPGEDWKMQNVYDAMGRTGGKASACLNCKQCEKNCPQKIAITEHLPRVAKVFEG